MCAYINVLLLLLLLLLLEFYPTSFPGSLIYPSRNSLSDDEFYPLLAARLTSNVRDHLLSMSASLTCSPSPPFHLEHFMKRTVLQSKLKPGETETCPGVKFPEN